MAKPYPICMRNQASVFFFLILNMSGFTMSDVMDVILLNWVLVEFLPMGFLGRFPCYLVCVWLKLGELKIGIVKLLLEALF